MKKTLIAVLLLFVLVFSLTACGVPYEESNKENMYQHGNGYFTTVEEWGGGGSLYYSIVYANDTKVMYFIASGGQCYGITPLYNTDGTLQIYNEE